MDPPWDRGHGGRRPGTASVRVTDLSWHGLQNPRPLIKDDGSAEMLLEEYLSPSKLGFCLQGQEVQVWLQSILKQALAQVEDLQQVTVLEMCVDTRENSLGNFGAHLPNLNQLKLNNSLLASIRWAAIGDMKEMCGKILWMVRCGLADLDGICSLQSLKELYMSYNNISDLSQVCLLDHLEVLDLEGNNVDNIEQVRFLGLCKKLNTLTLEGNLICLKPDPEAAETPDYNYRAEVKKLIPHLQVLDDVPAGQTSLQSTRKLDRDWLIVKESIKEIHTDGSRFNSHVGLPRQRLSPNLKLSTSPLPPAPQPWPPPLGRLPWTTPMSSPGSPLPEAVHPEELTSDTSDSSDLTHGVSRVLCGNPIKGLQERRQKLQDHSGLTALQPSPLRPVRSAARGSSGGDEDGLDGPQDFCSSALPGPESWRRSVSNKPWRPTPDMQEGLQAAEGSCREATARAGEPLRTGSLRRLNTLLVGESSQGSQLCSQEEEEQEAPEPKGQEEEKSRAPLGSCLGPPSPGPDSSKVTSSLGWPAGPSYPWVPPGLQHPSPPPWPSPSGRSRAELRGRRLSLNLSISPLADSEGGARFGERLTPFKCLGALRSPGSQKQPEPRGVRPLGGSGLMEPKPSSRGLRAATMAQAPDSFISYTPSPLKSAFSLLGHQAEKRAPKGPGCRQPILRYPAKAPEKPLLAAPARLLPNSTSTLHRLPNRPTPPPPTPPAQPQRSSRS